MGQFERDIQDRVECIMRKRESVERRLIRGSVLILNSKSNIGRLKAREREREKWKARVTKRLEWVIVNSGVREIWGENESRD